MNAERKVTFFRNGRNQAVRIPREFEMPGTTATMRKEGTRLIIETKPMLTLGEILDSLEPLPREHWMDPIESLPSRDVDL